MSDPQIIIPQYHHPRRLGETLHCAHLISLPQIQLVLRDQQHYQALRFGEILALRGWLKQETSDFFAEEWPNLLCSSASQHMLGFYLQRAALLDGTQVQAILHEQQRTGFKFGAVAVLNGWVKQQTINFFIDSLFPDQRNATPFIRHDAKVTTPQAPATLITAQSPSPTSTVPQAAPPEETVTVTKDDISWIG